jgi:hypothetical protein
MSDAKVAQENRAAMPPNVAETVQMYDAKILETENFLARNPDPRLTSGARELLSEYRAKREKVIFDFEHPAPAPPPAPTPQLINQITDAVLALMPDIVARVVVELQKK